MACSKLMHIIFKYLNISLCYIQSKYCFYNLHKTHYIGPHVLPINTLQLLFFNLQHLESQKRSCILKQICWLPHSKEMTGLMKQSTQDLESPNHEENLYS